MSYKEFALGPGQEFLRGWILTIMVLNR
jgi:hypothetical protein